MLCIKEIGMRAEGILRLSLILVLRTCRERKLAHVEHLAVIILLELLLCAEGPVGGKAVCSHILVDSVFLDIAVIINIALEDKCLVLTGQSVVLRTEGTDGERSVRYEDSSIGRPVICLAYDILAERIESGTCADSKKLLGVYIVGEGHLNNIGICGADTEIVDGNVSGLDLLGVLEVHQQRACLALEFGIHDALPSIYKIVCGNISRVRPLGRLDGQLENILAALFIGGVLPAVEKSLLGLAACADLGKTFVYKSDNLECVLVGQ